LSFANEPITGKAVLIRYTYKGDNNLDGAVNLDNDFSFFVDGYNNQLDTPASLIAGNLWLAGDYNYDGVIDLPTIFRFSLIR